MPVIAWCEALIEALTGFILRWTLDTGGLGLLLFLGKVRFESLFPCSSRLPVVVGSKLFRGSGVEDPHHIHGLMVCDEDVHVPSRFFRFLLEAHEQVHAISRARPSIDDVPQLHEMCLSPIPFQLIVHEARVLEYCDEVVIGSMHVADDHDPLDLAPFVLRLPGSGYCSYSKGDEKQDGDTSFHK